MTLRPTPPCTPYSLRVWLVGAGLADGLLRQWPPHLAGAAGVFQCAPQTARDTRATVLLWTDDADNAMGFGAAMEGVPWPPPSFVQLRGTQPACVRTWDD